MAFGWPTSGSVQVSETALRKGKIAEISYLLSWAPVQDKDGFVLEYKNFEIGSFDGIPADDPRLKSALPMIQAGAAAIPKFLISEDGHLLEFLDYDKTLDAVLDIAKRNGGLNADQFKQLEQQMRSPQAQQLMQEVSRKYWTSWVETWIDLEIGQGESLESVVELPIAGAAEPCTATLTVSCREVFQHEGKRSARLTMDQVVEGDSAKDALFAMLAAVSPTPIPEDTFKRAEIHDHVEGVWEVATLLPHEVTTQRLVTIETQDNRSPRTEEERHDYRFHWVDLPK